MNTKTIPLWQVLEPGPQAADFGAISAAFDRVSVWLKGHPEYCLITVCDCAPVDWQSVHAVLAGLVRPGDELLAADLSHCQDRLAKYVGILV